ncbi:uncharacterized protein LAESUDRAFT_753396 [Laetiporus sulphureus 93-53]|uniref:Uncharacterized protein n=1 Tax=Laetiporus sulphureus 93-53 TaxID=1314785 RepID=A0A165B0P8_9APHY|nr:uncharacterized protein LAESUDRAFT_753396 [Laetiporus sulphureus 93-53]KZT00008.1 hypothetical protein LAESUDRAFT_753396 [Laetiporus sulphureus 93-53]
MYSAGVSQHVHLRDVPGDLESGRSSIEENGSLAANSYGQVLDHDQPAHDSPYEPISQNAYTPQSCFKAYRLVDFSVDDQRGIMLADALNGCERLSNCDDFVFTETTAQKMSLRILLPGYPEYDRQVIVRNSRTPPESITVGKLAQIAAKEFNRMLEKQAEGNYHLSFSPDDVVLLGVNRVAKGSIQPRFGIIRPQASVFVTIRISGTMPAHPGTDM